MMRLLVGAFMTVVRVRLALWILPWDRLARSLTIRRNLVPVPPSTERLAWAVKTASRAVPYATCLTQALALQQVLARYGYRSIVQVGVRDVDGRFLAHAWVEHNEQTLLGTSETIGRYSRFFTWPASQIDHS